MTGSNQLQRMGGLAGIIHGAALTASIIFFLVLLSPLLNADADKYVAFVADNQVLMRAGNLIAYWLTGGTLVVFALALNERLKPRAPALTQVATVFALIWAALCICSANLMINDTGMVASLYHANPAQAATAWPVLLAMENGIVSGNEIVGSLWILLLSLAALRAGELPRTLCHFGVILGAVGLFTSLLSFVFPETKDLIMIFGLGAIPWFIWLGVVLLRPVPGPDRRTRLVPAQQSAEWGGTQR